ncbi:hypothetical protein MRX96_038374 [Rhipicephalus microplus]
MAAAELPTCCREVERKFKVPPDIQRRLLALGARLVSRKTLVDTYYDTEDYMLCLRDHWLRLRGDDNRNTWELKHRKQGDVSCGPATAYREERGRRERPSSTSTRPDWGFSVGEIEVVLAESDDGSDLAGAVDRATAEIAALSAQLGVDQESPPHEGKVESYLRLRRPELYNRLVECIWYCRKS